MTPTYPIREVLNLIDEATVNQMLNLVKLLESEVTCYTQPEHTVILEHVHKRRIELEHEVKRLNN